MNSTEQLLSKTIAPLDIAAIVFFLVIMVGIGFYYYRKTTCTDDFFAGGRSIPGWISGLSYFVTCFSAMAFVGNASIAYKHGGWFLFLFIPLQMVIPMLLSVPIAARWQRTHVTTVPEFLNQRYGSAARYFFALVVIPSRLLDNGNRVYVTYVFISVALGVGKGLGLWGSSFIILVYTFLGGIWAVVATDVIQFFLKAIAVILAAVLGIHLLGGLGSFVVNAPEGYWNLITDSAEATVGFAFGVSILSFVNKNSLWSLIQRYTSTPTAWEAMKVPLITAFAYLTIMPLITLPPMIARQAIPDAISALVASGLSEKLAAERSYILLCMQILPAGLMGLVVIAIFSSTMSSLSAEFNIISAVCTLDLYKTLIKKGKDISDRKLLWIGRLTTILVAVLCTLVGAQVDRFGGSFTFVFTVIGLAATPTYLPVLYGLFDKRTPGWGAILSFFIGITTGFVLKFGLHSTFLTMVLGNTLVTLFVCFITGLLYPVQGERKRLVEELFERIRMRKVEEQAARKAGTAPAGSECRHAITRVIAWGCLAFALFLFVSAFITRNSNGLLVNGAAALGLVGVSGILFTITRKA